TMFALQQPVALPSFDGVATELFPVTSSTVFTDLWLEIRPGDDRVDCSLHYRTELFDADAVERLARQYQLLVRGALDAPDTPISRLPLLDDEEILRTWSSGGPAHEWQHPVHEAIDRQARATPDATAVVFEDRSLTYAGLVARAGTIARHL